MIRERSDQHVGEREHLLLNELKFTPSLRITLGTPIWGSLCYYFVSYFPAICLFVAAALAQEFHHVVLIIILRPVQRRST